jgi:predicted TPR repeat methyltransferase
MNTILEAVQPPAVQAAIAQCLSGDLSPAMTIMELLCHTESAAAVRDVIATLERRAKAFPPVDPHMAARIAALVQLAEAHAAGCERIAAMLRSGMDTSQAASSVDEGIAFAERLFDWSVGQSEEASVALYSLGSAALLDEATREVVRAMDAWGVLSPSHTVLQIGCGTGRFERAIAPSVRAAVGIDVSQNMVDVACRQCAGLPNVHIVKTDGRDLRMFEDGAFDLVYAVDSFPYLVQAGPVLADVHIAEAYRVLRVGGDLLILNYSYRGDVAVDVADVRRLALVHGFTPLMLGTRPFELWNGVAFRLHKHAR